MSGTVDQIRSESRTHGKDGWNAAEFGRLLGDDLLFRVNRPGQYLGNEWGAVRKPFRQAQVRLCLAFPDLYELGMSNFGQRILYQLVNSTDGLMADRTYAPAQDMEELLRSRGLPLWGWESRERLTNFDLVGFSLQYELTFTNVLNMLDLSGIPLRAAERSTEHPLIFGGGPSAVNPEPMSQFMDFFIIGDGEIAVPQAMELVGSYKREHPDWTRMGLLLELQKNVPGVYAASLYHEDPENPPAKPREPGLPARVLRQVCPLEDSNQPSGGLVSYLSLVHDREVLEVRRGCDRGCRFCQPGYTFLPVRERSAEDLIRLSKAGIQASGHEEYSMLSLCVSDYTSLHESVRALNREHAAQRTSMSFPSQRADRMNLEIAEELKAVRKSGITLAPEAGTERLRAVINKGLSHEQIISAIDSAYKSGWTSVKLYFMIGLPTETDEDLQGIVDILKEATERCRKLRKDGDPAVFKRDIEFTCTISNFVPKPFTPFQWFGQTHPDEFTRKQRVLREMLRNARLRNVTLNCTEPQISLLEAVISRGGRHVGDLIHLAWSKGCRFDAWDDRFRPTLWHESARELGMDLVQLATLDRPPGSKQPWDVIHAGLADWWLLKEWEKSLSVSETAPCTENTCHACGVCTELETHHSLASPKVEVMKKNPFVKELAVHVDDGDVHPSLFFEKPGAEPAGEVKCRMRAEFTKTDQLKFISHLDLQHLFIRAARRAALSLAYTQGFNPSPKISIALSLPVFAEGTAELADFELAQEVSPEEFIERMNAQLPEEVRIRRARWVPIHAPSLATLIGSARYVARAGNVDNEGLQEKVRNLLAMEHILVEQPDRKSKRTTKTGESAATKTIDIRPGIFAIKPGSSPNATVELHLSHGSRMHVKPTDVLKLLAPDAHWEICRTELLSDDGRSMFDLT